MRNKVQLVFLARISASSLRRLIDRKGRHSPSRTHGCIPRLAQRMGYLQRLELENFKSYAGKQTIGPFDRFTAVIGPNGAGKSNLMDAISFVLGINSGQLRSAHLGELVHRPIGGETDENVPSSTKNAISKRAKSGKMPTKASVSAYYAMDDRVVVMSRSVAASTGASEYRIDGRVKTFAEYADFLASQNILVKARNFLVFQGDVESVASKTGRELTRLFEQVCGSEDFKADYERLFDEQERALEASAMAFNQKRAVVAEMRSITSQKEDVVRFEELDAKRGELIIEQMLWKLFHLEASAKQAADEITAKQSEVKASNDHAKVAEEEHQAAKRTQARAQKELLLFERKVKKAQQDYDQQVGKMHIVLAGTRGFGAERKEAFIGTKAQGPDAGRQCGHR